tara:strand:+ start:1201 stop:1407 length:207 start_codon:yes stop_codon:yes gene_type:complete
MAEEVKQLTTELVSEQTRNRMLRSVVDAAIRWKHNSPEEGLEYREYAGEEQLYDAVEEFEVWQLSQLH